MAVLFVAVATLLLATPRWAAASPAPEVPPVTGARSPAVAPPPPLASAPAPTTLGAAEADLDAAYRAAEVAAEQVNQADAAFAAADRRLRDARTAVSVQQEQVARLRAQLGGQAAALYRSGGWDPATRLLLADDPDQFLRGLTTGRAVRDQQERQLAGLQSGVVQLRTARDSLAAAQQAVSARRDQVTAQQMDLQRTVSAAGAVVDRMTAQQRAQLAARAVAKAVRDRAQAQHVLASVQPGLAEPAADAPAAAAPELTAASGDAPAAAAPTGASGDGSNSRVADSAGIDNQVPDITDYPYPSAVTGAAPDPTGAAADLGPIGVGPPAGPGGKGTSPGAARVLAYAAAQVGDRYVWGASGPDAFDCSGLTSQAWARAGVGLPRTAADQSRAGRSVSRADLQPGDLVFFYVPISHVGIYLGNGQMINASNPRTGVKISPVFTRDYVGAVRPG